MPSAEAVTNRSYTGFAHTRRTQCSWPAKTEVGSVGFRKSHARANPSSPAVNALFGRRGSNSTSAKRHPARRDEEGLGITKDTRMVLVSYTQTPSSLEAPWVPETIANEVVVCGSHAPATGAPGASPNGALSAAIAIAESELASSWNSRSVFSSATASVPPVAGALGSTPTPTRQRTHRAAPFVSGKGATDSSALEPEVSSPSPGTRHTAPPWFCEGEEGLYSVATSASDVGEGWRSQISGWCLYTPRATSASRSRSCATKCTALFPRRRRVPTANTVRSPFPGTEAMHRARSPVAYVAPGEEDIVPRSPGRVPRESAVQSAADRPRFVPKQFVRDVRRPRASPRSASAGTSTGIVGHSARRVPRHVPRSRQPADPRAASHRLARPFGCLLALPVGARQPRRRARVAPPRAVERDRDA